MKRDDTGGDDDIWQKAVAADGAARIWPSAWSVSGPAGAWTWGDTTLADEAAPLELSASATLVLSATHAPPLFVTVTGLIDPIDGLFSVRLTPAGEPFAEQWRALVQATLALGEPVHDDIGLMALDLGTLALYIDRLDHHVEIRPRLG